jgi:hypothetical protein
VKLIALRGYSGLALAVLAGPFCFLWNSIACSSAEVGLRSQARTFATFLPVLVVTTMIWGATWVIGLRLAGLM